MQVAQAAHSFWLLIGGSNLGVTLHIQDGIGQSAHENNYTSITP